MKCTIKVGYYGWEYVLCSAILSLIFGFFVIPVCCRQNIVMPVGISENVNTKLAMVLRIFFPISSMVLISKTPKSRRRAEDVLISGAIPYILILFLVAARDCSLWAVAWLVITLALMLQEMLQESIRGLFICDENSCHRKNYFIKRCLFYVLFIPLLTGVCVTYYMQLRKGLQEIQYLQSYTANNKLFTVSVLDDSDVFWTTSLYEWESFNLDQRKAWLEGLKYYLCSDLGVTAPNLFWDESMDANVNGYYIDAEVSIYLNPDYYKTCTIQEAVSTLAHECYHRYEMAVIGSLTLLEKSGFQYEQLAYYQDAVALLKASQSYAEDKKNYVTYRNNELETQASVYGEKTARQLSCSMGWQVK